MNKEAAARDAAEFLRTIEAQQKKREDRIKAEGMNRQFGARSGDMVAVVDAQGMAR